MTEKKYEFISKIKKKNSFLSTFDYFRWRRVMIENHCSINNFPAFRKCWKLNAWNMLEYWKMLEYISRQGTSTREKKKYVSLFTKATLRIIFASFLAARLVVTNLFLFFSHILSVWQPLFFSYCLLIIGWNNNNPSRINISNSHANALLPRKPLH